MLATPPDQVKSEIMNAYRRRAMPQIVRPIVEDPAAGIQKLAEVIRSYWRTALEPHWERLRAVLEGDVLYRARQMADGGASRLFADLHPELSFDREALLIEKKIQDEVTLDGRGLLFVPSVFCWPHLLAITKEPWQPTLVYPARGVGMLWEPAEPTTGQELAELLGPRRAAVLSALDAPRSTTEVARRLNVSPASVSQHLSILRRAGLVQSARVRRTVLYARTPRGDGLVNG
jgi:biotin operon repressor